MILKRLRDYLRSGDNLPLVVAFLALAISGLPLLAVVMYQDANDPESKSHQIYLEREFRAIKHLPQATEVNYGSSQKSGLAYVGATYESDLGSGEACSYYDHELATHGWFFYEEQLGDRSYCKGKYKATLVCRQHSSKSQCEITLKWGFEALGERYFNGDRYRSRGCSD